MKCDACGKNEATVHFTQLLDGEKTEMQLCKECAAQKGITSSIGAVENIVSKIAGGAEKAEGAEALVCANCGMTYRQFQEGGRFGCGECYGAFEDRLKDLLRKIHGSIQHVGKAPAGHAGMFLEHTRLSELREKLKHAIQAEQFEEAALLRDEIKRMERARHGS